MAAPMIGQSTFQPPLPPAYGGQQRHGWGHHHDGDDDHRRRRMGNSGGFGAPAYLPPVTPYTPGYAPGGYVQPGYLQQGYGQAGWTTTSVPRGWGNDAAYGYSTWAQPIAGFGGYGYDPVGYNPGFNPYAVPTEPWYVRIAAALFG